MSEKKVILVDCPRDAIQGLHDFIPASKKAEHINTLISSGLFDWIDFGSFVSPKAVPQMADTEQVLEKIVLKKNTRLLVIVGNGRGAKEAGRFEKIQYVGYPFSISETFQVRNTNKGIQDSFTSLREINDSVVLSGKETVVYISMAFGNPYGDVWSEQSVIDWIGAIKDLGVKEFSLADTTSSADEKQIKRLFEVCTDAFPDLRIGAHLHSERSDSLGKIKAAYEGGCRKFDGAMLGYGGCPFAQNDLVGNIPSEDLLFLFQRGNSEKIQRLQDSFRKLIS